MTESGKSPTHCNMTHDSTPADHWNWHVLAYQNYEPTPQDQRYTRGYGNVKYKLCTLMYDVVRGTAPGYLRDLCRPCGDMRLRSGPRGTTLESFKKQLKKQFCITSHTVADSLPHLHRQFNFFIFDKFSLTYGTCIIIIIIIIIIITLFHSVQGPGTHY